MGSFWSCSRVVLGSSWSRPEVVLGSFWGCPEVVLGSFWACPEIVLGSSWGCPEIVLESSWGRPGVVLESFSSRSGGVLEHLESVLVRPGGVLDHFWLKQKSDARAIFFLGASKPNRARRNQNCARNTQIARATLKLAHARARDVPALGAQDACRASGPVSGPTVRGAKPSPRAERLRKRTPAAPFYIIL